MAEPHIALYGATGFTGRLVARQLANKTDHFVVAGRSKDKLGALIDELSDEGGADIEARVAPVDVPAELDWMLEGAGVLINCAGPFLDIGQPVVEAALRNDAHYFDTTGEQPFIKWVRDELGERASASEVALVPGCAYEYATGDFAARLAAEQGAREIAVCYAVRGMGMSHGTKKSIVRVLSHEGYTFADRRLQCKNPAYRLFDVPLPNGKEIKGAWIPGGEPLWVPEYADVTRVESCVAVGAAAARVMKVASPLVEPMMSAAGGLIDRLIDMTSGDPHEQMDESDFSTIAFDPDTSKMYAALLGGDPYRSTARIIVEAATRTLADGPGKHGFTSPAALFDPHDFADATGMEIVEAKSHEDI